MSWAVVDFTRRGPFEAFGPYASRADARQVCADLNQEAADEGLKCRCRVVPMSRFITHREVVRLLGEP